MKQSDFVKRDDLCHKGQSRCLLAPGGAALVKVGNRWYATVDDRRELLGLDPNHRLAQPTVGPYESARLCFEAFGARTLAREKPGQP